MVSVNYVAVVVAAFVNMVVGYLWYGPLFGKKWMALMKISPEQMAKGQSKGMGMQYTVLAITSLIMSYVLANAVGLASLALQMSGASSGIMVGAFNWLGFIVPITMGTVLWEGKSWTLWVLNAGYYLVALMIMGAIIASF